MNINSYYKNIPQYDAFLDFHTEKSAPDSILPDFVQGDEACVCIYGASESAVKDYLSALDDYSRKLALSIKSKISKDEAWDLEIKPIFLFESEKDLLNFIDFANHLDDEAFFEMIQKLQLIYNEPWISVRQLNHEKICEIIHRYKQEKTL
ncbi:MAG: hypothetical protein IJ306_03600 [Oscillospiraceae bacterium]|nr:hypothetical protein [Oscillospiraceae bacterium]